MHQPEIVDKIQFNAEKVAAYQEEFTPDYAVHGIYFGEGDPEQGGQHWNFTRSLNDDDGVCTVKEIQEVTVYGGIEGFRLTRHSLVCRFSEMTAQSTRTRSLHIRFETDNEAWEALLEQAMRVFDGETYFEITS